MQTDPPRILLRRLTALGGNPFVVIDAAGETLRRTLTESDYEIPQLVGWNHQFLIDQLECGARPSEFVRREIERYRSRKSDGLDS